MCQCYFKQLKKTFPLMSLNHGWIPTRESSVEVSHQETTQVSNHGEGSGATHLRVLGRTGRSTPVFLWPRLSSQGHKGQGIRPGEAKSFSWIPPSPRHPNVPSDLLALLPFYLSELLPGHLAAQDVAEQWEGGRKGSAVSSQSPGRGVDSSRRSRSPRPGRSGRAPALGLRTAPLAGA